MATQNASFICNTEDMMMDDEHDDCCDYDEPIVKRARLREPMPSEPIVDKTSPALRKAIQDELKEMVVENLTHSMLNQVSRFANIAQELIMVRSPIADVRQRKRRRANYQGISNPGVAMGNNPGVVMGNTGEPLEENALTGEAAENETYASKLVCELISAFGKLGGGQEPVKEKGPVEELVEGIAAAKKSGLNDLAENLEAKLHEVLSKQFLDTAAKKLEDEKGGPISRDRALVGPVKPINGTAVTQ